MQLNSKGQGMLKGKYMGNMERGWYIEDMVARREKNGRKGAIGEGD